MTSRRSAQRRNGADDLKDEVLRTGVDPKGTISCRGWPFFVYLQRRLKCDVEQIGILIGIIAIKFCLSFHKTCRASIKGEKRLHLDKMTKMGARTEKNREQKEEKVSTNCSVFVMCCVSGKVCVCLKGKNGLWSWCTSGAQLGIPPGSCEGTISFDIGCCLSVYFISIFLSFSIRLRDISRVSNSTSKPRVFGQSLEEEKKTAVEEEKTMRKKRGKTQTRKTIKKRKRKGKKKTFCSEALSGCTGCALLLVGCIAGCDGPPLGSGICAGCTKGADACDRLSIALLAFVDATEVEQALPITNPASRHSFDNRSRLFISCPGADLVEEIVVQQFAVD